jgi:hypothetical protein
MKFTCRRAQIASGRGVVVCAHIVEKNHKCSPSERWVFWHRFRLCPILILTSVFRHIPFESIDNVQIFCVSSALLLISLHANDCFETWLTAQRAWHKQIAWGCSLQCRGLLRLTSGFVRWWRLMHAQRKWRTKGATTAAFRILQDNRGTFQFHATNFLRNYNKKMIYNRTLKPPSPLR